MDRNRGIWGVIACILIVGLAVTFSTSRFITRREAVLKMENDGSSPLTYASNGDNAKEESALRQDSPVSPPVSAETPTMAAARISDTMGDESPYTSANEKQTFQSTAGEAPQAAEYASGASGPDTGRLYEDGAPGTFADTQSAAPGVAVAAETISPAQTDPAGPGAEESIIVEISPLEGAAVGGNLKEYYLQRLNELDSQIQKMRAEQTNSTTYSMKLAAENELKLWDGELNTIYGVIIKGMTDEESGRLVEEERIWMKKRDSGAVEAAKKYSGGTLEGLEYTASLAESTKARAYDLVRNYMPGGDGE